MIHETEQDYKLEMRDSQNLAENEEQRNLRLQRLRESRSLEKVNPYEYKRKLNSKDMTDYRSLVTTLLVERQINGTAPQYLKDLTKNREISRYSLRSNKGILLVDNSAKAKKTLGDRAFVNAAPRVWNRLPLDIRLAISYDNFKSMLKTHFFRLAFYD